MLMKNIAGVNIWCEVDILRRPRTFSRLTLNVRVRTPVLPIKFLALLSLPLALVKVLNHDVSLETFHFNQSYLDSFALCNTPVITLLIVLDRRIILCMQLTIDSLKLDIRLFRQTVLPDLYEIILLLRDKRA